MGTFEQFEIGAKPTAWKVGVPCQFEIRIEGADEGLRRPLVRHPCSFKTQAMTTSS
jgi:hypothetical protein